MKISMAILVCSLVGITQTPAISVWINEIHYDNVGADTGEFVEIAGAAGTSLNGYSLVLYDGSGGTSYASINLSGIIPNQQNGFGVVTFSHSGIQNGGPDGIALAAGSTLIQFLSYEGAFSALGGAANGLMSSDIGVTEDGTTQVGYSLQLTGIGTQYSDFRWSGPISATPGTVNTGQTFSVPDSSPGLLLFGLTFGVLSYSAYSKLCVQNKFARVNRH
jgi:hypothetical protein